MLNPKYQRVIPRDLFNEANLLKCVGRLVLLIEDGKLDWRYDYDNTPFEIYQDESDGSIKIANIHFWDTTIGERIYVWNPLNSRAPWPVVAASALWEDGEEKPVFDSNGNFIFND